MKVIVVGCTHAGTSAVKNILNEVPDADVTVYERNDNVSFLSCGIALYVGGVVKDSDSLFYSNPEELANLGTNVHMEHDVLSIDVKAKSLIVRNLKTGEESLDSYDKLVMTTGSWPLTPPIPGIDQDNILLCKNFNQAKDIINRAETAKKITVVGAGYIGIELVEAFAMKGKEVTLIDGLDRILNKYLDREFTDVIEDQLRSEGITLALNQQVSAFLGDGKTVSGVETAAAIYESDLVILCIGFRPMTELVAGQIERIESGAIIVDEYMRTSNPDVFAAGDSAVVHYNPTEDYHYIPLATNAVRQGMLIGKNIKEPTLAYRGTQGTSGLHLFGLNIGSTGLTESSAKQLGLTIGATYFEDNYRPEFMPTTENVQMKLVYDAETHRILGGQLMSKYDITQSANTLSLAIQAKMTIEDLAISDFFFQPHFDRPWNYLNLLAQKAMEDAGK